MADDLATVDLAELLQHAEPLEDEAEFGEGDQAFRVRFKRCSRRDLDDIARAAQSRRRDRTGVLIADADDHKRYRIALRDKCLVSWSGLTVGKVLAACSMQGNGTQTSTRVEYTPKNALVMLEYARTKLLDAERPTAFDDWVFERATDLAERVTARETGEKNV